MIFKRKPRTVMPPVRLPGQPLPPPPPPSGPTFTHRIEIKVNDWPIIPVPGNGCTEAWQVPPDVRDAFVRLLEAHENDQSFDPMTLRRVLDSRCQFLTSEPD